MKLARVEAYSTRRECRGRPSFSRKSLTTCVVRLCSSGVCRPGYRRQLGALSRPCVHSHACPSLQQWLPPPHGHSQASSWALGTRTPAPAIGGGRSCSATAKDARSRGKRRELTWRPSSARRYRFIVSANGGIGSFGSLSCPAIVRPTGGGAARPSNESCVVSLNGAGPILTRLRLKVWLRKGKSRVSERDQAGVATRRFVGTRPARDRRSAPSPPETTDLVPRNLLGLAFLASI